MDVGNDKQGLSATNIQYVLNSIFKEIKLQGIWLLKFGLLISDLDLVKNSGLNKKGTMGWAVLFPFKGLHGHKSSNNVRIDLLFRTVHILFCYRGYRGQGNGHVVSLLRIHAGRYGKGIDIWGSSNASVNRQLTLDDGKEN